MPCTDGNVINKGGHKMVRRSTLIAAALFAAVLTPAACSSGYSDNQLSVSEGQATYEPVFRAAQASVESAMKTFDPLDAATWPAVRAALDKARSARSEYQSNVRWTSRSVPMREELNAAVNAAETVLSSNVERAYRASDINRTPLFTEAYPARVSIHPSWVAGHVSKLDLSGDAADVASRIAAIRDPMVRDAASRSLQAAIQRGDYGTSLKEQVHAVRASNAALKLGRVTLTRTINALPASSSAELVLEADLDAPTIEFAASGEKASPGADLAIRLTAATNGQIASFDISELDHGAQCSPESQQFVTSRRQVGLTKAPNPEIDRVQNELNAMASHTIQLESRLYDVQLSISRNQQRLQDAHNRMASLPKLQTNSQSQSANAFANVSNSYFEGQIRNTIYDLERDIRNQNREIIDLQRTINDNYSRQRQTELTLARLPSQIDVPEYLPYEYIKQEYLCVSHTEYGLKESGSDIVWTDMAMGQKAFFLADGLDSRDPDRSAIMSRHSDVQALDDYRRQRQSPPLDKLLTRVARGGD